MKLPRDVPARALIAMLERRGYKIIRQSGSHARLEHPGPPLHRVTVPLHPRLKVGLLNAVLASAASHLGLTKQELMNEL